MIHKEKENTSVCQTTRHWYFFFKNGCRCFSLDSLKTSIAKNGLHSNPNHWTSDCWTLMMLILKILLTPLALTTVYSYRLEMIHTIPESPKRGRVSSWVWVSKFLPLVALWRPCHLVSFDLLIIDKYFIGFLLSSFVTVFVVKSTI